MNRSEAMAYTYRRNQLSFGVCTECNQSLNDLLDGGEFDLTWTSMEDVGFHTESIDNVAEEE